MPRKSSSTSLTVPLSSRQRAPRTSSSAGGMSRPDPGMLLPRTSMVGTSTSNASTTVVEWQAYYDCRSMSTKNTFEGSARPLLSMRKMLLVGIEKPALFLSVSAPRLDRLAYILGPSIDACLVVQEIGLQERVSSDNVQALGQVEELPQVS